MGSSPIRRAITWERDPRGEPERGVRMPEGVCRPDREAGCLTRGRELLAEPLRIDGRPELVGRRQITILVCGASNRLLDPSCTSRCWARTLNSRGVERDRAKPRACSWVART